MAEKLYRETSRGREEIPEAEAAEILAEREEFVAKMAATKYSRDRKDAYPSIQDQLDYIYHNSITKWKSDMIKPVKDAHPKP